MSAAHTPGPWSVFTDVNGLHYVSAGKKCIHEFSGAVKIDDARLIAASPDLPKALRELHRVCVGMDLENQMERPTEEEYLAAVAGAEAALQLVEGK